MIRVLLILAFVLTGAVAHAKSDRQRAAELVERAAALYQDGKLIEAAALFVEAYELSKLPNQLRNAAKAYAAAGRLDDAIELWRRYAAHAKIKPSERAEAEAQIALIEERQRAIAAEEAKRAAEAALAEERAKLEAAEKAARAKTETATKTEAAVVVAPPPPVRRDRPPPIERSVALAAPEPEADAPIAAYGTIALGGALAIAGGIVFAHAGGRLTDLDAGLAMRDTSGRIDGISRADATAELDGINTERNLAFVFTAVGGAALITGLIWWASR